MFLKRMKYGGFRKIYINLVLFFLSDIRCPIRPSYVRDPVLFYYRDPKRALQIFEKVQFFLL